MADDVDRAQERTEILRAEALSKLHRNDAPLDRADGICADCGEDIPAERMAATDGRADRCMPCKEQLEGNRRR